MLGREIKFHLSPHYKKHFDQIKSKFGKFTQAIVCLIAGGIPSLQEFKTFLGKYFDELKPKLSTAESFPNVMELTITEKCTVTNIDCLETIVDHYNIEKAKPHITKYKSSVDKICVDFKESVLDFTTVSTSSKYESIMFVLGWQQTDDLTCNAINDLLSKAFGDIANKVSFKYGLKRKLIKMIICTLVILTIELHILSIMFTIQLCISCMLHCVGFIMKIYTMEMKL